MQVGFSALKLSTGVVSHEKKCLLAAATRCVVDRVCRLCEIAGSGRGQHTEARRKAACFRAAEGFGCPGRHARNEGFDREEEGTLDVLPRRIHGGLNAGIYRVR